MLHISRLRGKLPLLTTPTSFTSRSPFNRCNDIFTPRLTFNRFNSEVPVDRFKARQKKADARQEQRDFRASASEKNKYRYYLVIGVALVVFYVTTKLTPSMEDKLKKEERNRKALNDYEYHQEQEKKVAVYSESTLSLYKRLPLGLISSWWGNMTRIYVPESLRGFVFGTFAKMYGCNMDESERPIESFETFGQFFTRKLKPGVRPVYNADVVSPADGKILHFGEIQEDTVEQIKGITYELSDFFGEDLHRLRKERRALDVDPNSVKKKLYHCVIYLAPGDYHGFHSPTEWKITDRRHFPGHLFPVAPAVVSRVQGLFALNERVVLTGEWPHGFFSYTPVGATNVGSIKLEFDDVKTNVRPKLKDKHYDRHYDDVNAKKGDCLGFFHMGSTIVLIFESPEFDFMVQTGQKIQMGQPIGQLRDQARELNLKDVKGRGLPYAGWWFPRAWRLRLSYMKARGLFLIFLIASVVAAGDVLGSINVLNGVVAKRNAPRFDLEGGFMSEMAMSNSMRREILRRYTEQLFQRVLRQRLSQRRSLSDILEMKMKEIMKQRRR
ncbi:hypothetical protein PROFUN_08080 [Planoprotostelium fungivorum]|uniref:phosphatidylserine decarboxylase n=1 Tax=Planoprotostelium fungivorum TaxID=1890364 RepID=A0A2P6NKA2_9EUKA|nr:hypothetical protein PROFUN_08080 [Planoprotostelium fungivorum]